MPRSSDSKLTAVELKEEGNQLFRLGKFDQAAIKFTKAIELDRSNAVLYANRAACHLALKRFVFPYTIDLTQTFDDFWRHEDALYDAEKVYLASFSQMLTDSFCCMLCY
jgi:tetratricopeptide (TPR) repeat protein